MRIRSGIVAAAALLATLFGSGRVAAQSEPTLEVRLRSVNDILDNAEYIGGLLGQEDPVKQFRALLDSWKVEGKGIEGLDPKRPFGLYAVLTPDVASSPVVGMVPIADKDRFLGALKERLSITPEKADGDTQKINVPGINELFMKFANGYLYLARDSKHLVTKDLVNPKEYFAKDDGSVMSVLLHIDRVPAELKTFVIGQLELGVQEELKKAAGNDAEKKLKALLLETFVSGIKMVTDDAKDISFKIFIDPKTDEISADFVMTPKTGTPLAKTISGLAGKTSLPAGIVASKNSVIQGDVKVALPPDLKKKYEKTIDELVQAILKDAGDRAVAEQIIDALLPTFKAAELDNAAVLVGPNDKGKYSVISAVSVKDGKEIEKLLKHFAPFIPADMAEVTFDVEKIGNFTLHKIEMKNADEEFTRLFGTKTIWLATSDNCIVQSIETDGTLIRAGLKAKPVVVPVLSLELSSAKALPVFEKTLKPDEIKALLKDTFGNQPSTGKDTVSLTVEGGAALTVKLKVKGKAVKLASTLDQFKIK